jgi:hypothetical protein
MGFKKFLVQACLKVEMTILVKYVFDYSYLIAIYNFQTQED